MSMKDEIYMKIKLRELFEKKVLREFERAFTKDLSKLKNFKFA